LGAGIDASPGDPLYARQVRLSNRPVATLIAAMLMLAGGGCGKSASVGAGGATTGVQPLTTSTVAAAGTAPAAGTVASASTPAATGPVAPATAGSGIPSPPRPPIVQSPIPFGPKRKAEMVRYALRHYGLDTYRLIDPHVIVIHYTETPDFQSTFATFAPDMPDSELHELPNTCAHFVVDAGGTIHQLVPLGIMCRHTVGLNWTAIGVEHVGHSDAEVLDRPKQISASLRLVRWLRCRFHIPVADVIGHNESLSSPYHHENVVALRTQTHSDFNHADMRVYRTRLRAAGAC
jgi:N-acetylmuramoyl-L-alanine amidase